jgi:uncharacterized membrane protein YeiH
MRWLDLAHQGFVLIGAVAFAVSGAAAALAKRMDLVGVLSLAAVTAVGGGIVRDLLIGATPPAALVDPSQLVAAVLAGLAVFLAHGRVRMPRRPVLVFDAIGLGLFCVEGAVKGTAYGLSPYAAALAGTITGVGGGLLRDVLARDIPMIFRTDSRLYVVPALAGAAGATALVGVGAAAAWTLAAVAGAVTAVRLLSLRFRWNAPASRPGTEI